MEKERRVSGGDGEEMWGRGSGERVAEVEVEREEEREDGGLERK